MRKFGIFLLFKISTMQRTGWLSTGILIRRQAKHSEMSQPQQSQAAAQDPPGALADAARLALAVLGDEDGFGLVQTVNVSFQSAPSPLQLCQGYRFEKAWLTEGRQQDRWPRSNLLAGAMPSAGDCSELSFPAISFVETGSAVAKPPLTRKVCLEAVAGKSRSFRIVGAAADPKTKDGERAASASCGVIVRKTIDGSSRQLS